MIMETDNRVGYFFLGLGLGTAVGLLFAPKSGAESRNYLRSKTQEGTSYLKNQGEQLVNRCSAAHLATYSRDPAPTPDRQEQHLWLTQGWLCWRIRSRSHQGY